MCREIVFIKSREKWQRKDKDKKSNLNIQFGIIKLLFIYFNSKNSFYSLIKMSCLTKKINLRVLFKLSSEPSVGIFAGLNLIGERTVSFVDQDGFGAGYVIARLQNGRLDIIYRLKEESPVKIGHLHS